MTKQTYQNHIRFYPPHHFVFYPVMLILMGFAGYGLYTADNNQALWILLLATFTVITWLAFMLRQHYALTLQNRIVLLELRYRYFALTGQRFEELEEKLTEGQLFALRFAPDAELVQLAERAVRDNLPADAIKKAIVNWQGDYRRV